MAQEVHVTKVEDGKVFVQVEKGQVVVKLGYSTPTFDSVGEAIEALSTSLNLVVKAAKIEQQRKAEDRTPRDDEGPINLEDIPF